MSAPGRNEITPEPLYLRRRELIRNGALMAGTALAVGGALEWLVSKAPPPDAPPQPAALLAYRAAAEGPYRVNDALTSYEAVTTYNNFYELGLDKGDPAANAGTLRPRPWTVLVECEVARQQTIDIVTLLGCFAIEERI